MRAVGGARLRQRNFRAHVHEEALRLLWLSMRSRKNRASLDGGDFPGNQRAAQLGHRLLEHRATPTR